MKSVRARLAGASVAFAAAAVGSRAAGPFGVVAAVWLTAGPPLLAQAPEPAASTPAATAAVAAESRRLVTPDDYSRFESLGAVTLSEDGRWVAGAVTRLDADGEVRFGPTGGGRPRVIENGARFEFSKDGAWIAVAIVPPRAERERLERERTQPRNDLKLVATGSDEEHHFDRVQTFSFSPDGRFLLMRRYRAADGNAGGGNRGGDASSRGVDFVIRELATGTDVNFGNVAEAQWAPENALLAMIVDADGRAGNGVRLYDAGSGRVRTLHAESASFADLTWREDSRDLAVFRIDPDEARGDTVHTILAWRDAARDGSPTHILAGALPASRGADTRPWRITRLRGLRWADDGGRLFFGVQERTAMEDDDEEAGPEAAEEDEPDERPRPGPARTGQRPDRPNDDEVPGVEIWHARDVDPVPQQRVQANQARRRSALTAWDLRGDPVILGGDSPDELIALARGGQRLALLQDGSPYGEDRMFGAVYRDQYIVDVATGMRTLVAERVEDSRGTSPGGRYLLFFRDDHFWVHDRERGETRNITESVPAVFANQEVDRPVTDVIQRPPYGVGGWTEGDRHVLLYDRYDVWRVRPDGQGGERVTRGAEDEVRHRLVVLDPDQEAFPPNGPWWVSLYGEWTKRSGYGQVVPGRGVERALFEDRSVGRLTQSKDEGTLAFVTQRFDEPPALHVADRRLRSPRPVIRTNEFLDEFAWGAARLIDYENEWGVPLQAALFYPADYEPGRTYPMIVYPYERRSQFLHSWTNPSDRSAYNTTVFTQNGYFVLQPDIVYRARNPGLSFMEAVLPAVDAALATGMIDPDRIGLTGHSWGGYQTTFAVTQTDRFAAAVAGAPLTNLVSMYLSFYWNTGGTDARIFEISQGRMEVPWWEDPESYYANSPVHHIRDMNTPLLMMFGTEDGAVEFNQGVEFYNAARRVGKDFVLLVYDGENHSLAKRANQIDYHRRSLEWFNHYLKGAPAPAWIADGVRYLDQQEKLKEGPAAGRVPSPVPEPVTVSSGQGS